LAIQTTRRNRGYRNYLLPRLGIVLKCFYVSIVSIHMAKAEDIRVTGKITESLPNTTFRIDGENGKLILAYLSGKMKRYRIKVMVGDTVEVIVDQNGDKGRIDRRL
jgi:translation initiation factor IF-1